MKKNLIKQNLSNIPVLQGNLNVAQIKSLLNVDRPVILEIGANCGQTTIDFIKYFPDAVIHCFEPDPRAINKFKKLINYSNVHLHEIAIGDYNGHVMFNQSSGCEEIDPDGWDHSGSIHAPKAHLEMFPWVKFENKIEVPIMRLDDWAIKHGIDRVDFIWADVQGAEGELISGATEILMSTRFFYTEYYDNECYKGQINLEVICDMLNSFLIIARYANDVLFENFFANKKLPLNIIEGLLENAEKSGDVDRYLRDYGAVRSNFS